MSRSAGSMSLTTRPAIEISPPVISSRPGHHAQQRALAAARRADDDDELAVGDLGVDAVDHRVGLRAVAVGLTTLRIDDGAHARPRLVRVVSTSRCPPGP